MKVLVLSITAGQGHNQTAQTICRCLSSKGIEAEFLDTLRYINPVLSESVSKGYLMSTKRLPLLYGQAYRLAEKRDIERGRLSASKITTSLLANMFRKCIAEKSPDVIICTHVFASALVTHITKKSNPGINTVGIITDFTIHPYWEDTDLDYYITANEILTNQMEKKGIPTHKVKPLGIPIDPKFASGAPKLQARDALKIPNKNTVLVMSGSMGYGKMTNVIRSLDESVLDIQIISVCGSNKKLYNEIEKRGFKKLIRNYGFINNVNELMDAADCIVSKPGGLTTSEALAKGLPMLVVNPIPGQEDRNVEFLLNNGAAIALSSTYTAEEAIYQLMTNKERLNLLHQTVKMLSKPNSASELADFIKTLKQ